MATSRRLSTSSLDDDWEDVADNYSVISLPASDDEREENPRRSSRASPSSGHTGATEEPKRRAPQIRDDAAVVSIPSSNSMPLIPDGPPSYAASTTQRPRPHSELPVLPNDPVPVDTLSDPRRRTSRGLEAESSAMKGETSKYSAVPNHRSASEVYFPPVGHAGPCTPQGRGLNIPRSAGAPIHRDPASTSLAPTNIQATCDGRKALPVELNHVEQTTLELNRLSINAQLGTQESTLKTDGTLADSLNGGGYRVDPVSIDRELQSLCRSIDETCNVMTGCKHCRQEAKEAIISCVDLSAQVSDLRPIIAEYALYWEKGTISQWDIPLDPSLALWLSSLGDLLSKVKTLGGHLVNHDEPKRDHLRLFIKLVDEIPDYSRQLGDFLPIMRIDFNEFRTQQMSLPSPTIPGPNIGPRHNYQIPQLRVDQLPRIRHAMYAMKDQVQRAIEVLGDCQGWLPSTSFDTTTELIGSLRSVLDAMCLALTRNGSEWIEADIGGPRNGLLSYAEFSNLDIPTIEDLTTRIEQICDLVHVGPAEARIWSSDMIREHHVFMLTEEQQLDALETVASILKEMMMPNHMKTRTEFEDFLKEV